jgi:hypothetical protein
VEASERHLLTETLRIAMAGATGADLDAALADFGWQELLTESPDVAVPVVFGLLGETGTHCSAINDVVLLEAGRTVGAGLPLPYAGGSWVVWERGRRAAGDGEVLDPELPLRLVDPGAPVPLAAGRRAVGWWLVGLCRAMIALARQHAVDRAQFGRPIASFQAVRHRLAEALVHTEGAEATLLAVGDERGSLLAVGDELASLLAAGDELGSLLAKAAAGKAALAVARHCQQVLGGIGFTAEHDLHRLIRRALVLDGLLGSARELTVEAGALLRSRGTAPRLANL